MQRKLVGALSAAAIVFALGALAQSQFGTAAEAKAMLEKAVAALKSDEAGALANELQSLLPVPGMIAQSDGIRAGSENFVVDRACDSEAGVGCASETLAHGSAQVRVRGAARRKLRDHEGA